MAVPVGEADGRVNRSRRILSSSGFRSVAFAVISIILILVVMPLLLVAAGS